MEKQYIVDTFLEKGFLPSPDILLEEVDQGIFSLIRDKIPSLDKPLVISKDLFFGLKTNDTIEINWGDFEESKVLREKKKNTKMYGVFLNILNHSDPHYQGKIQKLIEEGKEEPQISVKEPSVSVVVKSKDTLPEQLEKSNVIVVKDYNLESKKREVKDFSFYFRARYDFLSNLLKPRSELHGAIALGRVSKKMETEPVSVIGLVYDKRTTKNGNCILVLEDTTGRSKVFINKDGPLKDVIDYITLDEVIGVEGTWRKNMIFAKEIIFPDVPANKKIVKAQEEVYSLFISDIHVGSKMFLEKEFRRFIKWVNGDFGTDAQKEMAKKVKYMFIVGDSVDGVGIYPNQDKELLIQDINEQYKVIAELLSMVRKDISIIMCPGNHEASRLSEPQPGFSPYAQPLADLPNVLLVSNPSLININSSEDFEGVNVLMYHGYGYDYYVNNITPLREKGGYNRTDLVMKFLLQKRHLAPTHSSTLYVPTSNEDGLLIDKVPDIFVSGHVHNKSSVSLYKGVNIIVSSCWQSINSYQIKLGHTPGPGRVPVMNLKTREVKILDFFTDEEKILEKDVGMGKEI